MTAVGQSIARQDALSKVTGTAVFARDLSADGMLYMKLVFAGRPHAADREPGYEPGAGSSPASRRSSRRVTCRTTSTV